MDSSIWAWIDFGHIDALESQSSDLSFESSLCNPASVSFCAIFTFLNEPIGLTAEKTHGTRCQAGGIPMPNAARNSICTNTANHERSPTVATDATSVAYPSASENSTLRDQPSPTSTATSGTTTSLKRKRAFVALNEFKPIVIKHAKGATSDAFGVFGTAETHRGAYEPARRREVALTREKRACARCKKLKTSCGRPEAPYEMCRGCTSLKNPLSLRLPCFLETFIDARLFRDKAAADHPLYFPRQNVYDLRDPSFLPPDTHSVRLTQGTGVELVVDVARYRPQAGDKTAVVWHTGSGAAQLIEMPPFCIVCLEDAQERMLQYVESSRNAYIASLQSDDLTHTVLEEARHHAALSPNSTVRLALNLLAADRIIERDWLVSDSNGCDFPYVIDPDDMHHTKRPVTPMMDCQLDQLVIQGFLQPLRKELLEQLQTSINTDRHGRWYDIFLTTFVLLTNAEQLLAHSRRNAIRHGAQTRYNSPALATLYAHACKMFIAHFRFVCNFKGLVSIDWRSPEAVAIAKLDREQVSFLMTVRSKVQSRGRTLLDLRQNYEFERPHYWTHQIMFDGWSAGDLDLERHHIKTAPLLATAA